ncbi:MAG: S41 family peptidase [Bacteroidales bacterium]|nr:S41 family peptidase [Bacteroidales bacterium]
MKINFNSPFVTVISGVMIGVLMTLLVVRISANTGKKDWDYSQWRKLNLVLEYVDKNYVDDVDVKAVSDAAISAALTKLDPHSVYLPPVELTKSNDELSGNFEGIGITFNVPSDTAIVLSTIPQGPAEKVGLVPGDRILKVDGENIAGVKMPQDSMVRRMKGPAGTHVIVTVGRGSDQIPFEIVRDKIPVHCIASYFMLNDTTGYIKLSKFTATTYQEFVLAAADLVEKGMTSLVFDLRENSGGYFEHAYRLANEFLHKGDPIVYLEGKHRPRHDYKADGRGLLQNIKLSVLIDDGSASSSEIFAGAIQDNDRGVIIGRRSFGKGLVQEPVDFTDGSGFRLTVSRFYTPSGRCIQKPYTDDYELDFYQRYYSGELTSADSIKVDTTKLYYTASGRRVYGGGGIIPDVFVPIDTTKVSNFYISVNKKSTQLRFASKFFDQHREELLQIGDFDSLDRFFKASQMEEAFRRYALDIDGLEESDELWDETRKYMLPSLKGLVGRYSMVGENAFYYFYKDIDPVMVSALAQ